MKVANQSNGNDAYTDACSLEITITRYLTFDIQTTVQGSWQEVMFWHKRCSLSPISIHIDSTTEFPSERTL